MLNFEYYGHSAFLLDDGKCKLLFDPFLTGNPTASIKAEEVKADYVLVSHAHGDHIGDAPAIVKRTGAAAIGIPEVLELIQKVAPNSTGYGMNIGGALGFPFGKVFITPALHSSGVAGGAPVGFIVAIGGMNVYFAGDTGLFPYMSFIGKRIKIDVAILPIGDNYTMGVEDAAEAVKLLGARHVIPVHYNTWPVIEQDPAEFKRLAESASSAKIHIVKPGGSLELTALDGVV
ncbi:MAG: metal-dependent hydrolase [Selenomonadaceae bacterium]|nr:metal-dependent hydrolase [Selenomonadaceae bacterium]